MTRDKHVPAVGDVYEKRYTQAKGKRIRLTKYHHHEKPWLRYFDTETITHPASPQMVGRTGTTAVDQLSTQWRHVPPGRDTQNTTHIPQRSPQTSKEHP